MITREQYRRRLAAHWEPPGDISTSAWADRHMVLSPETSAKPGQWVTRAYQRQPMDAVSNPAVRIVVLLFAVQLAKTSIIKAAIARTIAVNPMPIMALFPRKEDARDFGDDHVVPMIRDVEALHSRIKLTRMGKAPRAFRGGRLYLTSAGAAQNVGGKAAGLLVADEINKYVTDVDEEGNPLTLALQRLTTFGSRATAVFACSPTSESGAITQWFGRSQQHDFFVPCPECGTWQTMWGKFYTNVRFDDQLPTREEQALTARYACDNKDCGALWDDAMRQAAVERGEFRTEQPFTGVVGYRASQLCSLEKALSQIVLEFLRAKDAGPLELKAFINTTLAETWVEQGEAPEWEGLVGRREEYPVGIVPRRALLLTVGADIHPDRIECEVVGWGPNRESWSVAYYIFQGNTADLVGNPGEPNPWRELQAVLAEVYPCEGGGELTVSRLFVDSGNQTQTVYQWVRLQGSPARVIAIKGSERGHNVGQPSPVDVTFNGRLYKSGLQYRSVNVAIFKEELYRDLRQQPPTPDQLAQGWRFPTGYCHFPKGVNFGDEHFKQLCAEQLVTTKDRRGRVRREWQQMRARNEALDCRVYARAAAWSLGVDTWDRRPGKWREVEQSRNPQGVFELTTPMNVAPLPAASAPKPMANPAPAPERVQTPAAAARGGSGWFGSRVENYW